MKPEIIGILIVDDMVDMRNNLRKLLSFEPDFQVLGMAKGGMEAVMLAKQFQPNIVLMDINMPGGMDGIGASEAITKYVPTAAIIMMSVQCESDYLRRSMLAGARDFLTKPFTSDEMVSTIRRVHEMQRGRAALAATGAVARSSAQAAIELSPKLQVEELTIRIAELDDQVALFTQDPLKGHLAEEIARLSAGIAHDLRSPITMVPTILDSMNQPVSGKLEKYLRLIRRRSLYCRWIIDNFLGIAFTEKLNLGETYLFEVFSSAFELFENILPPSLQVSTGIPKDLKVYADASMLRLIIMNLIINSVEAMPDGGRLLLDTAGYTQSVHIVIANSGPSLQASQQEGLFSLGYTTKPAHSGVGLYVSKRFARQQSGNVKYLPDGKFGFATAFELSIPFQSASTTEQNVVTELNKTLARKKILLERAKEKCLTAEEQARVSVEFQRITSAFAANLNNELTIIQASLGEALAQEQDENTKQALLKIARNCAFSRLLARNMLEIGSDPKPNYCSDPKNLDRLGAM